VLFIPRFLPYELLKPFLTEHTILEMLQLIGLKRFATGRNLEKTFRQDMPAGQLDGLKRHSGNAIAMAAGRQ